MRSTIIVVTVHATQDNNTITNTLWLSLLAIAYGIDHLAH